MRLLPRHKRTRFQPVLPRYSLLRHASEGFTVPSWWKIPRIEIPLVGFITLGFLLLGIGAILVIEDAFIRSIVKFLNKLLFWVSLGSLLFAGDNGRRFAHWEGLRSLTLRQRGVAADDTPKSRAVTRIFFSALLAGEISLLCWWLVVMAAPPLPRELFSDTLLYEEARVAHVATQVALYWWLPFILGPIIAGVLNWLEGKPFVGFVLLKTRLMIVPIVPVVGYFTVRWITRWFITAIGWHPPFPLNLILPR